ncbi:MAG TPA: caspase family protein [Actinocrinis sp.]|nr:caspase family protein [Actinocrinis sp.]
MTVFALLVGINAYREPLTPLRGTLNDIENAGRYLSTRIANPGGLRVLRLRNEEATKSAIVEGFRSHLGQAEPGDSALFWFSGHGSQARVPDYLRHLEPSGMMQTLVCFDSRHGEVTDLVDKELSVLIGEVADRGAHVALVLDCCHADGATREADEPALDAATPASRRAPALAQPPSPEQLLPELNDLARGPGSSASKRLPGRLPGADHVALSACHPHQNAFELPFDENSRGVFSLAVLEQLEQLGPDATYRELMTGARGYVESRFPRQLPVLYPGDSSLVDEPFLGGELRPPASPLTMHWVDARRRWELDGGACHGIEAGPEGDRTRVAVVGGTAGQEAEIVESLLDRCVVEPLPGWNPDPRTRTQYPVVISWLPLPSMRIALAAASPKDDRTVLAAVRAAVDYAGAGGLPSPHLRVVEDKAGTAQLIVSAPKPAIARIAEPGGEPVVPDTVCSSLADATGVVRTLEHIARWRSIRSLRNPATRLLRPVRIEVVPAPPGVKIDPRDGEPLSVDRDLDLKLNYTRDGHTWVPPRAFIRLRNTASEPLFCVLLDLTDRYLVHSTLFPGAWVGANYAASVANGTPITISLPPDRLVRSGAQVTDHLMVLVSQEPISSTPFTLPRLGERVTDQVPRTSRSALRGTLERLGLMAHYRDMQAEGCSAKDWTVETLTVVTSVP